tara:strand:+ start:3321 stop:4301 length:981 start_codon:yes stop_codon:yes gene_type:complete
MEDLKKEVEALLFSAAKTLSIDELSVMLKRTPEEVTQAGELLKNEYEERNSPIIVIKEDEGFKVSVKDKYVPLIQKIVVETELPKTIIETLAVIAYKHPALQSEITKIRTNKAYDHLRELEELGYITREKHGRTKKIKLTSKFFQYFDIPHDKLKEAFSGFEEIEKLIQQKQEEAKEIRKQIKARQEKSRKDDKVKKKVDEKASEELKHQNKELLGSLEVVDELPEDPEEQDEDELKVVDVPKETPKPKVEKKLTPEEKVKNKKKIEKQKKIEEKQETDAEQLASQIMGESPVKEEPKKPDPVDKELEEAEELIEEDKEKIQNEES